METMGIIFSNIYDSKMGALTELRTSASIPVGGRYRQIDFVLSSMANSGIKHIGIITKYNYHSLMDHLGSCQEWDLNLDHNGVCLLPPFSTGHTGVYRGKLEAMMNALSILEDGTQEYVVLADTNILASIDFRKIVEEHIASGCKVTMVAKKGVADGKTLCHFAVKEGDDGTAAAMSCDYVAPPDYSVSMGMFVMKRTQLIETLKDLVPHGYYHFERDFLMNAFKKEKMKLNLYHFRGTALSNDSVESYFSNSMALLDINVRRSLFRGEVPIYTKVRDEVPTMYGNTCQVANCIVADGCRLYGHLENSIIFRSVNVEEGAEVRDSIVMQGSVVERGASIRYTIIDKDVTIKAGTKLLGAPGSPLIIRKGVTV